MMPYCYSTNMDYGITAFQLHILYYISTTVIYPKYELTCRTDINDSKTMICIYNLCATVPSPNTVQSLSGSLNIRPVWGSGYVCIFVYCLATLYCMYLGHDAMYQSRKTFQSSGNGRITSYYNSSTSVSSQIVIGGMGWIFPLT